MSRLSNFPTIKQLSSFRFAKIKGSLYKILFKQMDEYDGLVDLPDDVEFPEMWLSASLDDQQLLETLLHETIHVHLPCLKEEAVSALAKDQANLLSQFGFTVQRESTCKATSIEGL